ncbi:hypothetical protein YC2023_083974 [Brassica napus]
MVNHAGSAEIRTNSASAPSILSLHPGQLQLVFPDQTARDPTAISSRDFNSNSFVLSFATTPIPRLDQHITSSHPFEVLLVVRFLQSANKRLAVWPRETPYLNGRVTLLAYLMNRSLGSLYHITWPCGLSITYRPSILDLFHTTIE